MFSDHSWWISKIFGWSKMTVSKRQYLINMIWYQFKSIKKLLKDWRRLLILLENLRNKLSNFTMQEIISDWKKSSQILKTFYCFSIHILSMIYVDIGKNFKNVHLIQLSNTIKLYKDFKCIIIQLQMISLELLLKYQDFWDNFLIFKLTILQNSDILSLLVMEKNFKMLEY